MLALTKRIDYALIALSHLAAEADRVISAREIAQTSGVPLPILTNILKTLAQAGVVLSSRGASSASVRLRFRGLSMSVVTTIRILRTGASGLSTFSPMAINPCSQ